jgi:hypothetical protein
VFLLHVVMVLSVKKDDPTLRYMTVRALMLGLLGWGLIGGSELMLPYVRNTWSDTVSVLGLIGVISGMGLVLYGMLSIARSFFIAFFGFPAREQNRKSRLKEGENP